MATISQNLAKLSSHLEDAYTAIDSKGGTVPGTHNATNLSAAIESIPSGGGSSEKYGMTIDQFWGDMSNGQLQQPTA